MDSFIQIAPLAVMLIAAVVIVLRGLRRDGDDTNNQARGGMDNTSHLDP